MAAVSAIFWALVLAMELAGLSHFLPFPPVSYPLYDPAEIPVYFLYLAMGLRGALLSTAIVVLGLSPRIMLTPTPATFYFLIDYKGVRSREA